MPRRSLRAPLQCVCRSDGHCTHHLRRAHGRAPSNHVRWPSRHHLGCSRHTGRRLPALPSRVRLGPSCARRVHVLCAEIVLLAFLLAAPPNKRLKLPGGDRSRGTGVLCPWRGTDCVDRKSTRLNSSHTVISYAVFCLKKKTK